ncbi:MAG: LCP family protein [Eubacteriales bacterium]
MVSPRKVRRLRRKTPLIVFSLVLLALVAAGCVMAKSWFFPNDDASPSSIVGGEVKDKRLNVLLLGIDAREGEDMARTDTIILASVDTKTKQMALLSIPRDTRVQIPGHGWDKINSASAYGGPELTMRVVSSLLDVPIRYYVLANFSGFKNIVDALGGVTINVDQNMYHEDEEYGYEYQINLSQGVQRLNGDKALQYVRYRGYVSGDIERTQNQQKFLMALAHEMMQPGTILKLPSLAPEIYRYVKTNLPPGEIYKMAMAAKKLEGTKMLAQTLPGRNLSIDEGSYWGVDPAEARLALVKLLNGETVDVVADTPLNPWVVGVSSFDPAPNQAVEEKPPAGIATDGSAIPGTTGSKTKPGGTSGTSGTGGKLPPGSVKITPGGTKTSPGTGSSSGTGTVVPGTGGTSTGGTSTGSDTNPAIPGSKT